jgi:lantibiotic leader peptide-processing serine protease
VRRTSVGGAVTAALAVTLLTVGPTAPAGAAPATKSTSGSTAASNGAQTTYVVLYERGASDAAARSAVTAAGGSVVSSNTKVGYAVATSRASDFATRAAASSVLVGAARNQSIGHAPKTSRPSRTEVEKLAAERKAAKAQQSRAGHAKQSNKGKHGTKAEPLAYLQWDMKQIDATATGSYRTERGSKKVLVGVIDTGIDGSHPDIAPNFDARDSRNFTKDMVDIDGPCEFAGCVDPANWDDDGHGTHVASTIASPINGLGIAGVAPNVTLVNIRAGQDSGYFFLQATLDALTYAGDLGVDVVNMSFYTDPWLYNCTDNPADSPAEQQEQRTIREATQRAITYARNKGVLPVAAAGNGATDLGHPVTDETSPDYPVGTERTRAIDNSCITVPTETNGVVAVTSTGISTRKAYYSDYGIEQADVSAPGGDVYDTPTNTRSAAAGVLAAYPARLAELNGDLNPDGTPNNEFVVRDCTAKGVCGYYQYLQGTSMASPHAVGVAALIVSSYGTHDRAHPSGLTLPAGTTQGILLGTARDHACPAGGTYTYTRHRPNGTTVTDTHTCEGTTDRNGFYGEGIVNALAAVSR